MDDGGALMLKLLKQRIAAGWHFPFVNSAPIITLEVSSRPHV
jgi:hypothetical protein